MGRAGHRLTRGSLGRRRSATLVGEFLSADAGLIHQSTFGQREHRHPIVVIGVDRGAVCCSDRRCLGAELVAATGKRMQCGFVAEEDDLAVRLAAELEELVVRFPSLGEAFAAGQKPEALIRTEFKNYSPRFLADKRIEFMCHCSPERLRSILKMLPMDQLQEIRDDGPFPLEMRCHFCNTRYQFSQAQIQDIYAKRNESS